MNNGLGEAVCPYYRKEAGGKMCCELATFRFPDFESKMKIKGYCCDMDRHKECLLYKTLTDYYERKYEEVGNESGKQH